VNFHITPQELTTKILSAFADNAGGHQTEQKQNPNCGLLAAIRVQVPRLVYFLVFFVVVFFAVVFLVPQHPFLPHDIHSPFKKTEQNVAAIQPQFLHRNQ
jgi:hypothetical protein